MRRFLNNNEKVMNERLGASIVAFRQFRQISQRELAAAVHLSENQVANYENGASRIPASLLFDASSLLRVSVAEFYSLASIPQNTIDDALMAIYLTRLSDRHFSAINRLLRDLADR